MTAWAGTWEGRRLPCRCARRLRHSGRAPRTAPPQVSTKNVRRFRKRWLNAFHAAGNETLENYLRDCSWGAVRSRCRRVSAAALARPPPAHLEPAAQTWAIRRGCRVEEDHRALQVRFTDPHNVVVDLTDVDMGCSGTWQGQAWDWQQCGAPEIFGWMSFAQQYALNVSCACCVGRSAATCRPVGDAPPPAAPRRGVLCSLGT